MERTSHFAYMREAVKAILLNWENFEWSLQGLGLLRMYFNKQFRLHIWDRRFAFPNASTIHDHLQWDFNSIIVSGKIVNHRYLEGVLADLRSSELAEDYMTRTIKAGMGMQFLDEPKPIKLLRCSAETYTTGMMYHQKNNEIHESVPVDGTVTLLAREHQTDGESARIFWRAGEEWVSAEPRHADPHEVQQIVQHALDNWAELPK